MHIRQEILFQTWLAGKKVKVSNDVLIGWLIRENGHCCWKCKGEEWCGHPMPLILFYKDGKASNKIYENLDLICPNCLMLHKFWKGAREADGACLESK